MTHKERQAHANRLMAILQGDEPAALLTEMGEQEPPPGLPEMPRLPLTSADRRDRAEIRKLRAQVLQEAPTCGFAPMQDNPIVCLALLCTRDFEDRISDANLKLIPEQVWHWCRLFQRIQLRTAGRWMYRYGRGDAVGIHAGSAWVLATWLEPQS
jgi:hypothetical protein